MDLQHDMDFRSRHGCDVGDRSGARPGRERAKNHAQEYPGRDGQSHPRSSAKPLHNPPNAQHEEGLLDVQQARYLPWI